MDEGLTHRKVFICTQQGNWWFKSMSCAGSLNSLFLPSKDQNDSTM